MNRGLTWTDLLPASSVESELKPLNDRERDIAATFYGIGFSDAVDILSEPCEPPAGGEETKEVVQ